MSAPGRPIPCDGCRDRDALAYLIEGAYQVRYCETCHEVWKGFETAQQAEGARLQRLLDLWQQDARSRLPLLLTPLDFPPAVRGPDGKAMVLT